MRHLHTITPRVVHLQALEALRHCLDWKPFHESVTVDQLLNLLVLMAASCSSLFDTVRRFFPFSHQTGSLAVKANVPAFEEADLLTRRLSKALVDVASFSRRDRRRHWTAAIDTHNIPYYGEHNRYVVGGQKKQGTKWFYSYASAVLLHDQRRYTVALIMVLPHMKPHEIVRALLDQIAENGLKIKGLTADSGFDSGETFLLLQERKLAYSIPLRRKGAGANPRNQYFDGRHRLIRWIDWTTKESRRPVRTRTLLWKGRPKTMVLAFQGWSGDHAGNVHQEALRLRKLYRRRFGIETSYRQKNQAQAKTTSQDPVYRLLLEGVAYLIRQLWVMFTALIAKLSHAPPKAWIGDLTLKRMIEWLTREVTALYQEKCEIKGKTANFRLNCSS